MKQNLLQNGSGELVSDDELSKQEDRFIDDEKLDRIPNFQIGYNPFWSSDESSDDDFPEDERPIYENWKILKNKGYGWNVLRDPVGKFKSYFFAYKHCSKEQTIDLYEIFQEKSLFRSDFEVKVSISECFKFCGDCQLCLKLQLLDRSGYELKSFDWRTDSDEQPQNIWKYARIERTVFLKKVRYLKFYHEADCFNYCDNYFYRNGRRMEKKKKKCPNYGISLAKARVKVSFPIQVIA